MNILVTNDDGIQSEGLRVIVEALRKEHSVYVVAPAGNCSGFSSSIHIGQSLLLEDRGNCEYALSGTPVDCVISALRGDYLGVGIDAVVSGINLGANMGTDVLYSGTCGAARQAALYGIPGIALSCISMQESGTTMQHSDERQYKFAPLAEFAAKNLKKLIALCLNGRNLVEGDKCRYFVNVNAPSLDSYKGARITGLSQRSYGDRVSLIRGKDGLLYSTCSGGSQVVSRGDENCDSSTVSSGYVSVSLLPAEPVCAGNLCGTSF